MITCLANLADATASPAPEPLSALAIAMWFVLALIGVIASAIFSGQETGIYCLNRVRLHLRAHRGHGAAGILREMVHHPNRLLVTLLIGNNMVNYLASFAIAVLLAASGMNDWEQVAVNAAILTPLLFVFAEVLPKDVFARYTDGLSYFFARPIRYLQIVFTCMGLLPLVAAFSRWLSRVLDSQEISGAAMHPRRTVTHLMREGVGQGLLSAHQSAFIERVLHPTEQTVADAMMHWPQVHKLRDNQPAEAVWALANRVPYSRFPLVNANGSIMGIVNVFDVLLNDPDNCPPLASLATEALNLPPDIHLRDALIHLQKAQVHMGIVRNEAGKPLGIVTLKDLVEPITGDLAAW